MVLETIRLRYAPSMQIQQGADCRDDWGYLCPSRHSRPSLGLGLRRCLFPESV